MPSEDPAAVGGMPGKVPTTAQVDLGELAINTRDGKLFLKRDNGNGTFSIVEVGSPAASGRQSRARGFCLWPGRRMDRRGRHERKPALPPQWRGPD